MSMLDYSHSTPQRIYWRVRSGVVVSGERMYSLSCAAVGGSPSEALANFDRYLPIFSAVQSRLRIDEQSKDAQRGSKSATKAR
ncbi:MAG: hypothetical protein LW835_15315 [Burkholderiaceae bacterium]|jgi:hypothetical protein|nr:hypothetical protein [Burkholderiaceae bacterium]